MNKLFSVLLIGSITALMPFFFFFIGIKNNYIDFYEIREFFNVIFVDQMFWWAYGVLTLILGSLFIFPKKLYLGGLVLVLTSLAGFSTMKESIALDVGTKLFAKTPFHIKKNSFTYSGTLLYEGRHHYYLRSDEHNRTLTFNKGEIDEAY